MHRFDFSATQNELPELTGIDDIRPFESRIFKNTTLPKFTKAPSRRTPPAHQYMSSSYVCKTATKNSSGCTVTIFSTSLPSPMFVIHGQPRSSLLPNHFKQIRITTKYILHTAFSTSCVCRPSSSMSHPSTKTYTQYPLFYSFQYCSILRSSFLPCPSLETFTLINPNTLYTNYTHQMIKEAQVTSPVQFPMDRSRHHCRRYCGTHTPTPFLFSLALATVTLP